MKHMLYRVPIRLLGVPLLVLATVLVACGPSPQGIAGATSTASTVATIVPQSSTTPEQAIEQLSIPATKYLYPSPDGTLLLAQYDTTIKLYTLGGQEVGSSYTGGGDVWSLLTDSSGVFISQSSGPLLIMDRQGQIHSTGLDVSYPQLSQNGQWIGGTAIDGNGNVIGAEIVARSGASARVLAKGGIFLGWQSSRAIYSSGGYGSALYALVPDGGAPLFLAQLSSDETPEEPIQPAINSPDGELLFLQRGKDQYRMLVGNQLHQAPLGPLYWVGPHDILTSTPLPSGPSGDYVVEDLATGKVVSDTSMTPSSAGSILAVSGDWMVTSTSDTNQVLPLTVVNYKTKASAAVTLNPNSTLTDIGILPVVAVGNKGTFLTIDTTNPVVTSNARPPSSVIVIITAALVG